MSKPTGKRNDIPKFGVKKSEAEIRIQKGRERAKEILYNLQTADGAYPYFSRKFRHACEQVGGIPHPKLTLTKEEEGRLDSVVENLLTLDEHLSGDDLDERLTEVAAAFLREAAEARIWRHPFLAVAQTMTKYLLPPGMRRDVYMRTVFRLNDQVGGELFNTLLPKEKEQQVKAALHEVISSAMSEKLADLF